MNNSPNAGLYLLHRPIPPVASVLPGPAPLTGPGFSIHEEPGGFGEVAVVLLEFLPAVLACLGLIVYARTLGSQ
jgi:hypothetical protein